MKKKTVILATSIGLFLVIASVTATLVLTPVLTTQANGNAANGSSASGALGV